MHLPLIPDTVGRAIRTIVVHCSATPSGQWLPGTGPAGQRTAAGVIDAWHAARGFKRLAAAAVRFNARLPSIGYHYVVDLDGYVWTGRDLCEIGAHVAGHNADSIGICLVGGAEREGRYTPEQWEALAALVPALIGRLEVPCSPSVGRVGIVVCGHRDLSPDGDGDGVITSRDWLKTCPGFTVAEWVQRGMRPMPQNVAVSVGAGS